MHEAPHIVTLTEHDSVLLPVQALSDEEAQRLDERYRDQIQVEPPSFRTEHQWRITAQSWVGFIPLTADLAFRLQPKVPLRSLFGMWEYAYRIKSFHFLDELIGVAALEAFYEQLALILARRVLDRLQKGLHRTYLSCHQRLSYVRGSLDIGQMARRPWDVSLPCDFQEHTADIEDNQILTYTLWRILSSGICSERVLPTVRNAYRGLLAMTTFRPVHPNACGNRRYHRLNQDYHPLHALSRFFLEQSGPTHRVGDRQIMPFLVDMARLFELFVAEWLKAHLPLGWQVQAQERIAFGQGQNQSFQIDLVLRRLDTGEAVMVLDTKYKDPRSPATGDVEQVVAYAEALGCQHAVLIYPTDLAQPLDTVIGEIHVRTLTFNLAADLETAGQRFLERLLAAAPGWILCP
ncbi:McrC family protein [Litorilinea aerophila]|uniref:Restriction endonuclease n=1 Tax=Litorilinea aerophila TaxID=1204385 RepID=A0A540VA54_9CHLR|nr:restriction endonuclease [Litorilinea aerophila]MCC9078502.1 McrC family protein [Litorilinea aerophila]OUC06891.1 hypothetical protein RY27_18210 [Litorilinea aerophila]